MTTLRSMSYNHRTGRLTATLCDYGSQKFDIVKTDDGYRIFNINYNEHTNRDDYEDLCKFIEELEYYEEERWDFDKV